MERALFRAVNLLGVLASISVMVLMFVTTTDVITRTLSDASLPGMIELAEVCLVIAVFFGMAQTGTQGKHIVVTLLTEKLPHRTRKVLQGVGWTLVSVLLLWMTVANTMRAVDSLLEGESRFGLIHWPIWPARMVLAVGLLFMFLVSVGNVVRAMKGKRLFGENNAEMAEIGIL